MTANTILQSRGLKRTACREGIISCIAHAEKALTEHEIKDSLQDKFDRTTFYRSFKTLLEHGLIHKIVVDSTLVTYAFNSDTTPAQHAHFYCEKCSSVTCLRSCLLSQPPLPKGFEVHNADMILKGVCNTCISR